MHGIGSQWQVWSPVLERLATERDAIAVDLPGFGDSPPPPYDPPPGAPQLAALVADFLDELGLETSHVAGHSLGGWVALELARLGRARTVTALAPAGLCRRAGARFVDVSLRLNRVGARLLGPGMPALMARPRARALLTGQMVARPDRLPAGAALDASRAMAAAPAFDAVRDAMRAGRFRHGDDIRVPVTVAFPDRDRLLTPRLAQWREELPPQTRFVTLRGCGHAPTWDDPEQSARVVLEGSSAR
jgi:pimeloyl-ACP methyl ester carboxylesterase